MHVFGKAFLTTSTWFCRKTERIKEHTHKARGEKTRHISYVRAHTHTHTQRHARTRVRFLSLSLTHSCNRIH